MRNDEVFLIVQRCCLITYLDIHHIIDAGPAQFRNLRSTFAEEGADVITLLALL